MKFPSICFPFLFLIPISTLAEIDEKAERYLQLVRAKPENEILLDRFFEAWIDSGTTKSLRKHLEEAAKVGSAGDWQILASFHEEFGQAADARPILDEALEKFPGNQKLRLARAKLAVRLFDFETALADLEPFVKAKEPNSAVLKLQGICLSRSGRSDEALAVWEKALKQEPDNEELRENFIEINLIEGLHDEAIKMASDLVQATEDPYKKAVRKLRLAGIAELGEQSELALETYREVIAASGEGTWLEREALSKITAVFMRNDDARGLLKFFNELREIHP